MKSLESTHSSKPSSAKSGFFHQPVLSCLLSLLAMGGITAELSAQTNYTYSTFAGIGGQPGKTDGIGGTSTTPLFDSPVGVAVRSDGYLYVADTGNSLIRLVSPAGVVTTIAGQSLTIGSVDGTGTAALFDSPQAPAVDSAGNLFIADYTSNLIRKITPAGVVTTFAGSAGLSAANDGTGSAARFNHPSGIAIDGSDNLYVTDSGSNIIRKITSAGVVTTVAGSASTGAGSVDGLGALAKFNDPRSVALDGTGNIYVLDTLNNSIRKIDSAGNVTTIVGAPSTFGNTDGVGTAARFNFPNGLAADKSGNLYVADTVNNNIRKVVISTGVVTTLAGPVGPGSGTAGFQDGTGAAARFNHPTGLSVDAAGNVYVADFNNSVIRKITSAGVVTTLAGTGGSRGVQNGAGYILTPAYFNGPTGAAADSAGNIYVTDTENNTIRKISPAGVVTTFAGNPLGVGAANGTGQGASFSGPSGVAVDSAGNVFVADTLNQLVRKITPAGVVTTYAGIAGTVGSANGAALASTFNYPSALAVDGPGNVYVADYGNHLVRLIAPNGVVSTLAGSAGVSGNANGMGIAATFSFPRAIGVDGSGNVYVADTGNNLIRKIAPGGLVLTFAGTGSEGGADGTGNIATFNGPAGMTLDGAGNLFVVDTGNSTIRKITPAGVVTTIGGTVGFSGNVDGTGAAAKFDHPIGIAITATGNLYIADTRNETIREGVPPGGSSSGGGNNPPNGSNGGVTDTGSNGTGITGTTGTDLTGITSPAATGGSGFFSHPDGVVIDSTGRIFVADTGNNCIKRIDSDGSVNLFAGTPGKSGSTDGAATVALFNGPTGIALDSASNLYVCDTGNSTIRMITAAGVVTTLAGTAGSSGSADGTGSAAKFSSPMGIAVDNTLSVIYVADSFNNTLRAITPAGVVTTIAGAPGVVGDADGILTAARFNNPMGIAVGIAVGNVSNVYVADTYNHTIRLIKSLAIPHTSTDTSVATTTSHILGTNVVTIAGSAGLSGAYDGLASLALFNQPTSLAVDSLSDIYIIDKGNSSLRFFNGSTSQVATIAGVPGISGSRDGPAQFALLNQPQDAIITGGVILISDTGNSLLRQLSAGAVLTPTLKAGATTTTSSTGGTTTTSTSSSSGGGGALDGGFAGAVLTLLGLAAWRKKPGSRF